MSAWSSTRDQMSIRKAPSRRAKAGILTFSTKLRSAKISGVWNTRATPAWLMACGLIPRSDFPSNRTVQESGVLRPTKQLSGGDLPAQLRPGSEERGEGKEYVS